MGFSQADTQYVKDYRDLGNLSFTMQQKANNLAIYSADIGKILRIASNNGFPSFGIMFNYKWLNVRVTTPIGNLNYANPTKGETDNLGLSLGYTGDHIWVRGYYEYYEGYHIGNPDVFSPNWFDTHDNYPYLPSLRSHTFYVGAYYGFNEDTYSHRALIWQNQTQKQSAGSWLLGVSAGYDYIHAQGRILPPEAGAVFTQMEDITGYETVTIAVNGGYTYTQVLSEHWSISAMFAPGIALNIGEIEEVDGVQSLNPQLGSMAEGRAILSYHQEKWYAGLSANMYMILKPINQDYLGNAHSYVKFNIGYRFVMPKSRFLRRFGLSD